MKFTDVKRATKTKALNVVCWIDNHSQAIKTGALFIVGAAAGAYVGTKSGRLEGMKVGAKYQCALDMASTDNMINKGLLVENYDHDSLEARDEYYQKVDETVTEAHDYVNKQINLKR